MILVKQSTHPVGSLQVALEQEEGAGCLHKIAGATALQIFADALSEFDLSQAYAGIM